MRRVRSTTIVVTSVLALASCGSDPAPPPAVAGSTSSTMPQAATAAAPSTSPGSSSTAPTTTTAETTTSATTTTGEPSTSSPTAADHGVILRGDGLGIVEFGVPQGEALSAIETALGPPTSAAPVTPVEAPWLTIGCTARSELVYAFGSLSVGFSDLGSGPVLAAWSAVGAETVDGTFATREGLLAGATPEEASVAYPGWAPPDHSAFAWMRVKAAYGFESGDGSVLLAGSGPDGAGPWLLTAGSNCAPDRVDTIVVGDAPIGVQFSIAVVGDDESTPEQDGEFMIVDVASGRPTEWASFGGTLELAFVGPPGAPHATAAWSVRTVDSATVASLWEVVDALSIPEGSHTYGNYEACRDGAVPLVDDGGRLVGMLWVDDATGSVVELAPDGCNELGGSD